MSKTPALPRKITKDRAPDFRDMDAAEFNERMEKLGLAADFDRAQLLRCVIRTAWGYRNGVPIPRPVAMLLRIATHRKVKLNADEVKELSK